MQVRYGPTVTQLRLPQVAVIASLPKAPSRFNPIADSEIAVVRRNYVLRRVLECDCIDQTEHHAARGVPTGAKVHGLAIKVGTPYLAEMVRAHMEETYGEDAYTGGYKVWTTIDGRLQSAANPALRQTRLEYDTRDGFRGDERRVVSREEAGLSEQMLADVGGLVPAVVMSVDESKAIAWTRHVGQTMAHHSPAPGRHRA